MNNLLVRAGAWVRSLLPDGAVEVEPPHPLTARVTVELDRVRTLRFTMAESAEFRRRSGHSILKDGINLLEMEEDDFLELLAVACSHDDPSVTAEVLAPHIQGDVLTDAVASLLIVLGEFSPPVPEGGAEDPMLAGAVSHLTKKSSTRSRRKR